MAISGFIKAAKKAGMKKSTAKKAKVENAKPKTFESELKNIRGMALKDETRNNKLLQLYKKYGKKIPAKLAKPVKRKEGGRTGSLLGTILKEQKDRKKIKKGKSISAKKGGKIGGAPHNRLY
tara:strand:+ start:118 stop:483 length:366 start_codon:yes stop_codon:yes gene_type:complete